MPYIPTDWQNGVTQFNETNMNKIEQGVADSQLITYVALEDIGLVDADFAALSKDRCAELFAANMETRSNLHIQVLNNQSSILRSHFAPDGRSGYLIVRKYTPSLLYFEFQALQINGGTEERPSSKGGKSWIAMYDDGNEGEDRFSEWRQSGGLTVIDTTVNPGSSVSFQAIESATAAIIHFRPYTDSANNRCSIMFTRGRNGYQVSNRFGTQDYFASVNVSFTEAEVSNSSATDDGIVIDRIDLI